MRRNRNRTARDVIQELVDMNLLYSYYMSAREQTTYGGLRPSGKPGAWMSTVSDEDKELLKQLKPEDMENVRWPLLDSMSCTTDEQYIKMRHKQTVDQLLKAIEENQK